MVAAAAQFESVTKEYPARWPRGRRVRALEGVALTLGRGEVLGLLGPNRAGKTTLVKLLLSLCRPTAGRVTRLGAPADDRRTLARVGYVHENPAFPRYLTAAGLLGYYGALTRVDPDTLRRRVPELLERVGLADRRREPIARYSKGMLQRLALAQSLVNDPELLVLDEPGEGLDLHGRRLVVEVVQERRRRGGSVLLVSHAPAEVQRLCDRVAVLAAGRLVHDGPLSSLSGHEPPGGDARPLERALERLYEVAAR